MKQKNTQNDPVSDSNSTKSTNVFIGELRQKLRAIPGTVSEDALKLISIIAICVLLICVSYTITKTIRDENQELSNKKAFSTCVKADDYHKIDFWYNGRFTDCEFDSVYNAVNGNYLSAYCVIVSVHGEEDFNLAVCIDASSSVILGVSVVDGTRSAGSGNYVLWDNKEYLDRYTNMNETFAYTFTPMTAAAITTSAINNAVILAIEVSSTLNGGDQQ